MDASELNVVRDEEIAINRKIIVVENQMQVSDALGAIHEECSRAKFTGSVKINYSQGGVANIETNHERRGLSGLFDEEDDESEEENEQDQETA
jgi:hypothetical protein